MGALEIHARSATDMEALGARLAHGIRAVRLIYVNGPLGAGKTTLVRGILRALGRKATVKSPTFTLVEPYQLEEFTLYHIDLYRLKDPEELEFLGIRDYFQGTNVCVIEWAERAERLLPPPDIDVIIQPCNTGRSVQLVAQSERGETLLGGLTEMSPEGK